MRLLHAAVSRISTAFTHYLEIMQIHFSYNCGDKGGGGGGGGTAQLFSRMLSYIRHFLTSEVTPEQGKEIMILMGEVSLYSGSLHLT